MKGPKLPRWLEILLEELDKAIEVEIFPNQFKGK